MSGKTHGRRNLYRCICDCGGSRETTAAVLNRGATLSCGCVRLERATEANTKHGHSVWGAKSSEYMIWTAIKGRCCNPEDPAYEHYGQRGVTISDAWDSSFELFLKDMGPRPSRRHSVDRINNDGPYSAENCRWATTTQQSRNKRTNVAVIRSDGKRYGTIIEAAEDVGVHRSGITAACKGIQMTSGGYGWRFTDDQK